MKGSDYVKYKLRMVLAVRQCLLIYIVLVPYEIFLLTRIDIRGLGGWVAEKSAILDLLHSVIWTLYSKVTETVPLSYNKYIFQQSSIEQKRKFTYNESNVGGWSKVLYFRIPLQKKEKKNFR